MSLASRQRGLFNFVALFGVKDDFLLVLLLEVEFLFAFLCSISELLTLVCVTILNLGQVNVVARCEVLDFAAEDFLDTGQAEQEE